MCMHMHMHLVWLLSALEIDSAIWVQIMNESVCISLCANALGKGINPSVLSTGKGN